MSDEKQKIYLHQKRKEQGLTQAQIAEYMGISVRQYQRLECGEYPLATVSFHSGLALCSRLKLEPYQALTACSTIKFQNTTGASFTTDVGKGIISMDLVETGDSCD